MNIFDYEDSVSRWLERAARDHEQLQRAFERSARYLRAIEFPSVARAIEAMERDELASAMAEVMRRQDSLSKTIESLQQQESAFSKLMESIPPSLGEQLRGPGELKIPALDQLDANPLHGIRQVCIARTVEEANAHLEAGWILIGAPSVDASTGEGTWALGWPHDEEPQKSDCSE